MSQKCQKSGTYIIWIAPQALGFARVFVIIKSKSTNILLKKGLRPQNRDHCNSLTNLLLVERWITFYWFAMIQCHTVVNFINVLRANFTYERLFDSFSYLHVTRENLPKRCSYEKCACKTLMKLTPGVNFINILRAAFAPVDPKSVKRYWQLDWILTLLEATGVKAVRKNMLVKSTPDWKWDFVVAKSR